MSASQPVWQGFPRRLREAARLRGRALKTRWLSQRRGTDVARWRSNQTYQEAWSDRHALMVQSVRPGDRVLDLGSGPRVFERCLPSGCTYLPLDVVPRGPGSLVCDLNSERLPEVAADVVIMSGVLEYLHAPEAVLADAARAAPRAVVSYSPLELLPDLSERRQHGWVNNLTEPDVLALLEAAGWQVRSTDDWWVQRVYHLERAAPQS